jgi:hypothetical protein
MTQILKLKYSWDSPVLSDLIDCIKVTKDQLETIIDGWLILDEEQFENYPNREELYVRKFHLSAIDVFFSTRPINDERLFLISQTPYGYKYFVH